MAFVHNGLGPLTPLDLCVEAALLSQRPGVALRLILALLQTPTGSHSTGELMLLAEEVEVKDSVCGLSLRLSCIG